MDAITLAYHSAFFDGEGSVNINSRIKYPNTYLLEIRIDNTNKEVLNWLKETSGFGKVYLAREGHEIWKDAWAWRIPREEQIEYLKLIQPYSIVKKKRIALFLQFLEYHQLRDSNSYIEIKAIIAKQIGFYNQMGENPYQEIKNPIYTECLNKRKRLEFLATQTRNIEYNLTDEEASYHTGIMDGEGHIGIMEYCIKNNNTYYQQSIEVSNIDYALLQYLKDTSLLGTIRLRRKSIKNRNNLYVWYLTKDEYIHYLNRLLPYLKIKNKQAELMIKFLQTDKGYHYAPKNGYTIKERAYRESLYQQMRELNKRGK